MRPGTDERNQLNVPHGSAGVAEGQLDRTATCAHGQWAAGALRPDAVRSGGRDACDGNANAPGEEWWANARRLFAVTDLRTHAALLTPEFPPTLTCFLSAHTRLRKIERDREHPPNVGRFSLVAIRAPVGATAADRRTRDSSSRASRRSRAGTTGEAPGKKMPLKYGGMRIYDCGIARQWGCKGLAAMVRKPDIQAANDHAWKFTALNRGRPGEEVALGVLLVVGLSADFHSGRSVRYSGLTSPGRLPQPQT